LQLKRELLRAEGLDVGLARVRRFDAIRWQPPSRLTPAPTNTRRRG
jgi:hypothetical protein